MLAVLVAGLTAQGARAGLDGTIRLWPTALVSESTLRLRDVAEIRGFDPATTATLADLALGDSPQPGGSRILALAEVREALGSASTNMASVAVKGSAECIVRRPAEAAAERPSAATSAVEAQAAPKTDPKGPTLRETIAEFFDHELAAYDAKADLQFGRTSAQVLDLRRPDYDFRIQRQSGPLLGLVNLEIAILQADKELQRIPTVVNVAMLRDVVVARTPINKGATVAESDLALITRRFTRPEESGLTDLGQAVGLRARGFIASGEMVDPRDLERVPLVKRGQMVEVVSRVGGVTVKTAAKASADAGYGEPVTLHLEGRSRDGLVGRVSGPRRVELGGSSAGDPDDSVLAQGGGR